MWMEITGKRERLMMNKYSATRNGSPCAGLVLLPSDVTTHLLHRDHRDLQNSGDTQGITETLKKLQLPQKITESHMEFWGHKALQRSTRRYRYHKELPSPTRSFREIRRYGDLRITTETEHRSRSQNSRVIQGYHNTDVTSEIGKKNVFCVKRDKWE